MADGGQNGLPVLESIAGHDLFHVLRLADLRPVDPLGLAVALDHVAAPDDIVLLHLVLEPLIDLVLGLGALDDI